MRFYPALVPICGLALSLFSSSAPGLAAQSAGAASGWSLLWSNQDVAARKAFTTTVAANPRDVDALRGLAVLDSMEDRPLQQIDHLAAMYKIAPDTTFADACWPMFCQACHDAGRYATMKLVAGEILANPSSHPQLKADAVTALVAVMNIEGDHSSAKRLKDSLGFITSWKVIGPFTNKSRSGFDTQFGPESEIDFAKTYAGDNDRPVQWRTLNYIDDSQCASISQALGMSNEQLGYAVTAVKSASTMDAHLTLDCDGAYQVFVNGNSVASHSFYGSYSGYPVESVEIPVRLASGWNTILVKSAIDDGFSSKFRARLTTMSGAILSLPVDPSHATGASTLAPKTPDPMPFVAQELDELTKTPETLYLKANVLDHTGDDDAKIAVAQAALALAPKSALMHETLADCYDGAGRTDDAKLEMNAAAGADPRLLVAQTAALQFKQKELTTAENIAHLKALLDVTPDSPQVWLALSQAYSAASLTGQYTQAVDKELTVNNGPAGYDIDPEENSQAYSAKMLQRGLKLYPNAYELLESQASMLNGNQSYGQAIAIYQKLLKWSPASANVLDSLGSAYYGMGQKNTALAYYRSELSLTPQSKTLLVRIADIDQELGHKAAAIAGYRSAVSLDPSDVSVRDKLDLTSGSKRPIDLVPETPTALILAHLPKLADAHDASAIWSLDECRRAVYPDGATVDVMHTIVTVMDDEGVKYFGTIPLDKPSGTANAEVQIARIIKPDGKIQDMDRNADGDEVAFPSLKPGDTIELQFQVTDYESGDLAGQFWSEWEFDSTLGPSRLCRYVLITPPDKTYRIATHGNVPTPVVSMVNGWKVTEWKATDIPQTKYERDMIGGHDMTAWLDISSVKDWSTIVKWYIGLSKSRCVPDPSVTQTALDLTKDCKTNEDKLRALVSYVRAIPYQSSPFRLSAFVPTEGKQVIREQYGDCKDKAALLTAMCAAVNIHSRMVLLSPRENGLSPFLPSPRFDHAIALVDTDKGPLFVDGTADKMQFGIIPFGDEHVPCLIIDPKTSDLSETSGTPIGTERIDETVDASINGDGKLSAQASMTFQGNACWMFRSVMSSVESSRMNSILARIVSFFAPNSTFDSGTVNGLATVDAPLSLNVVYHADHYAVTAGDVLILRVPWLAPQEDSTDPEYNADHRISDLDVAGSRASGHCHITVKIPDGYVPEELPKTVTETSPWGTDTYSYSFSAGVLTVDSDSVDDVFRVPASEAKQYLDFAKKSDDQMQLQLVFKKG